MSNELYGKGLEAALKVKASRDELYQVGRPQVFEQLEQRDIASLVKLKSLRVQSFLDKIEEDKKNDKDTQNNEHKLEDELIDLINYADMLYSKRKAERERDELIT